jgi:phosphatidylglycerol:prolipoprotein diacylglycerol transferase
MNWWQTLPYKISPYLFQINGFGIRYYSLMYLVAFVSVYLLIRCRLNHENPPYSIELIQDFFIWAALGVILGGRLGYVLFYNLPYYAAHPLEILLPFSFSNGIRFTGITGMSFHGGLLGVAVAFALFCRKHRINIWDFSDLIVPAVPLGYFFGRLGNFFNGELFGTPTNLPWGMMFPTDATHTLRHPSQLYEAFFEGIVLFVILWAVRNHAGARHRIFALYLSGYGIFRFFIEFVRQPDAHLETIALGMTMGQILCGLMVLAGIGIGVYTTRTRPATP